jgi:hypothetical protein
MHRPGRVEEGGFRHKLAVEEKCEHLKKVSNITLHGIIFA